MDEQRKRPFQKALAWFLRHLGAFIRGTVISLFSTMLVACIRYGVPWLTTALLLIVGITLSAPIRGRVHKQIALTLLIGAIGVVIWIFIPEASDGTWRPMGLALVARSEPSLIGGDNAAVEYEAVLNSKDWAEIRKQDLALDPNNETLHPYWTEREFPEWSRFLAEQESYLQRIQHASRIPDCHFSLPYSIEQVEPEGRMLFGIFLCAKFLVSSANHQIGEGQIDAGLDRYRSVLSIGRHLCRQDSPNFRSIGQAVQTIGTRRIVALVMADKLTDERVRPLDGLFSAESEILDDAWNRMVDSEKMHFQDLLLRIYLTDGTRIRLSPYAYIGPSKRYSSESWKGDRDYWNGLQSRLGFVLNMLFRPMKPADIREGVEAAFEPLKELPRETKGKGGMKPMRLEKDRVLDFRDDITNAALMHRNQFGRFVTRFAERQSRLNGNRILLALWRFRQQYGDWPQKLEQLGDLIQVICLIDPCNQGEYVYRASEGQFRLYSRGANGIDDGGQRDKPRNPREIASLRDPEKLSTMLEMNQDDILLWPPKTTGKALDLEFLIDSGK